MIAAIPSPNKIRRRHHRFRHLSASGVDLTFASPVAGSAQSACQIQNSTRKLIFARSPFDPKVRIRGAVIACELRNRALVPI